MDKRIDIIKGVHPGKLMESDLKKRGMSQRTLAERTNIPYQTINAILSSKRNLTTRQAVAIEHELGYEEGFLLILQAFYEIKSIKENELARQYPDKPNIRRILFWDIDFDHINWGAYKNAVVKRVLERGNPKEVDEIKRFYRLTEAEWTSYKKMVKQESHDVAL
jgi:addiction module HigA family antidote